MSVLFSNLGFLISNKESDEMSKLVQKMYGHPEFDTLDIQEVNTTGKAGSFFVISDWAFWNAFKQTDKILLVLLYKNAAKRSGIWGLQLVHLQGRLLQVRLQAWSSSLKIDNKNWSWGWAQLQRGWKQTTHTEGTWQSSDYLFLSDYLEVPDLMKLSNTFIL